MNRWLSTVNIDAVAGLEQSHREPAGVLAVQQVSGG